MSTVCHYCAKDVLPEERYCALCIEAAHSEFTKNASSEKTTCYNCKKLFAHKTILSHDGFCGRCTSAPITTTVADHKSIGNQLSRVVWQRYYTSGKIEELCYCCGTQHINVWNYQCGHIVAQSLGGSTTLDNLRPICSACNQGMSTNNMVEWASSCGFHGTLSLEMNGCPPTPIMLDARYRERLDSLSAQLASLTVVAEPPHKKQHQCIVM